MQQIRRTAALALALLVVATSLITAMSSATTALAVSAGNDVFRRTWERTDRPVAEQAIARTWMWSPAAFTVGIDRTPVIIERSG